MAAKIKLIIISFLLASFSARAEFGSYHVGSSDDYLRAVPVVAYELLDFCGVKARRPFVDRLLKGTTATVIMGTATYGTKFSVRARRPDGSDLNSFPSGHTALAFMGAELLRQDYGPWIGLGGYIVASGVGAMRVLDGHHWARDVVAGAGIGIFSAYASQWLLPLERRWFGLDNRRGEAAIIAPGYAPESRAVSLTASIIF